MFSKLRYSIAGRNLSRKARQIRRTKMVHNFSSCRKSAVIYDATDAGDFEIISGFIKFMASKSIKTDLIGFVNLDQVHGNLLLRENCHFFCKKDLSLLYRPKTIESMEFLKQRYDILFDFTLKNIFPLRYLATLSPADFKVGRYCEGENDLDLMIDIRKDPRLDYLIEQVKIYVSLLNNPQADS